MKITSKILHIPPHLSTSWTQVRAIYLKENTVVVSLLDGVIIEIPGLPAESRNAIFDAYAAYLEEQNSKQPPQTQRPAPFQIFQVSSHAPGMEPTPMPSTGFDSIESMASALQHNMAQANMPDLPPEVLNKIAAIAKIVAPEDIQNLPKPEPHCNCPHCQIARAIHGGTREVESTPSSPIEAHEEIVSDKDLSFQQWDIVQTGEKLYSVASRLDPKERYSVYLGHPVGCTCGKQGCEHILAVLKS